MRADEGLHDELFISVFYNASSNSDAVWPRFERARCFISAVMIDQCHVPIAIRRHERPGEIR